MATGYPDGCETDDDLGKRSSGRSFLPLSSKAGAVRVTRQIEALQRGFFTDFGTCEPTYLTQRLHAWMRRNMKFDIGE